MIKDGHADAWVGPVVSAIVELTTTVKMKMLPIKQRYLDRLQKDHAYGQIFLPKGKYYFCDFPAYGLIIPTLGLGGHGTANVTGNITGSICSTYPEQPAERFVFRLNSIKR